MGRADLIGNGKQHLIPTYQPVTDGSYQSARRKNSTPGSARPVPSPKQGQVLTPHTGLPPRSGVARPGASGRGKPLKNFNNHRPR